MVIQSISTTEISRDLQLNVFTFSNDLIDDLFGGFNRVNESSYLPDL